MKLSFDKARLIAAFLVIAVHTYPFLSISPTIDILFSHIFCRIAVPLFLMITGYFIIPKALENKENLKQYIMKIIKLYFLVSIFYLLILLYAGSWKNITIISLVKDILINGVFYHLWYFPALILGLPICYFLMKKWKGINLTILLLILYLIGLLGDSYYGLFSKIEMLRKFYDKIFLIFDYTRNGLFYAPIFLYLGYYINEKKYSISKSLNILLLVISIVLMEIEGYLLYSLNFIRHDSMYVFLLPVMFFLFCFLVSHQEKTNKKYRNIATTIYITHPFFIIIVNHIVKWIPLKIEIIDHHFICYLVVSLISLLFSILYCKFKEILQKKMTININL